MHKRTTIDQTVVNEKIEKQIKQGYPLLEKDWFQLDQHEEGTLININTKNNRFLAKAYIGKQNVGSGWVLTRDQTEQINQSFFTRKLKEAIEKRSSFFQAKETTAFRLFNSEGDGIGGLQLDYYAGYLVVTWYSQGIYTFRNLVLQAIRDTISFEGVYEKKRFAEDGSYTGEDDFVEGTRGEFPLLVKENGITYATYLNDGPMTGIFLDQRLVRKQIMDKYAVGKRVLNLFSYTGAFSVAAAMGGASETTSVDLANRSREKTEEQFSVNGIDPESQRIVVMDAFRYFQYAKKKELVYDLVVLDPPSFARSKKTTFRAAKDYSKLVEETIPLLSRGGVLVASTNAANVTSKQFKRMIHDAFQAHNLSYDILEEHRVPVDFASTSAYPKGSYLKVLFIKTKG
ncbi:class I SAM-dependent rRNA methyltransferase [Bacillus sp. Marseille-P3800]|uniref:class I SAM-dependent rRNA methyltransferase n=1 Tax=Bacillus sp. Marseille-P3800 TaxID=2014782 RepID=UPI000C0805A1|nr:class I SAM-dependent rRNA methyltransferase [Bacillus sp. Marseille-P3800]